MVVGLFVIFVLNFDVVVVDDFIWFKDVMNVEGLWLELCIGDFGLLINVIVVVMFVVVIDNFCMFLEMIFFVYKDEKWF